MAKNYFDSVQNAKAYIKMVGDADGSFLIERLKTFLPEQSTLLELGMGPGTDLDLLAAYYNVTGSDLSQSFLDIYKEKHRGADLLQLDAVTIQTDRKFDCLYSNKVLHHLTRADLQDSIARQADVLNANGITMHSFWEGNGEEEFQGLRFTYYTKDQVQKLFEKHFSVLEIDQYTELAKNDSIYVIAAVR